MVLDVIYGNNASSPLPRSWMAAVFEFCLNFTRHCTTLWGLLFESDFLNLPQFDSNMEYIYTV